MLPVCLSVSWPWRYRSATGIVLLMGSSVSANPGSTAIIGQLCWQLQTGLQSGGCSLTSGYAATDIM